MGKDMNIKKGDTVKVIAGKDKGAQGKVISVLREEDRVIVEGVNLVKRHTKSVRQTNTTGGIITREAPIHVSNVALVDPEDNKPTKVGYRVETVELENGRTKQVRVRFAKRSGKDI